MVLSNFWFHIFILSVIIVILQDQCVSKRRHFDYFGWKSFLIWTTEVWERSICSTQRCFASFAQTHPFGCNNKWYYYYLTLGFPKPGFFLCVFKKTQGHLKKTQGPFWAKNSTYRRLIQILQKNLKTLYTQNNVFHGGHTF